jgi:BirA family biotin operon repressor/biotin-[acetyl-CoA-carboxylase] ligase
VLLRLDVPPERLPVATLLLGLAVADAIQQTTNLICDLRWPNDVLIRDRKVAGILAQLAGTCVIAGIGINVNQEIMPDGLRTPATSLQFESGGVPQNREDLLIALLAALDEYVAVLRASGPSAILAAFSSASSYALNRRVVLEEAPQQKGTTMGLDENGFLLVRMDSGNIERIAAGGVRAAP